MFVFTQPLYHGAMRWAIKPINLTWKLFDTLRTFLFGFGFFVFNGISTLFRLLNGKAILLEEQ